MEHMPPTTTALRPYAIVLVLAVLSTCYFQYLAHAPVLAFVSSLCAITPCAFLMGYATEQIAMQTTDALGGLLNATFGNAAEAIIAFLALRNAASAGPGTETEATMIALVQASMIGSILGNLLLVMGLAFLWGGMHYKQQRFSGDIGSVSGSLLLLMVLVLSIPTCFSSFEFPSPPHEAVERLSRVAAVVLLILYGLFLYFQLVTHAGEFHDKGDAAAVVHEHPSMSTSHAALPLVLATALISWMAEVLVHSVEEAAHALHLPNAFIGTILLPLFGNAAEHFSAVSVAAKDKMDLSFAISMGSSTQIAVFVAPLMVIVGWLLGVPLSFDFGLLPTLATFLSVLIVNSIIADGKSHWLEGATLLGAYTVLGAAFLFVPEGSDGQSPG